MVRDPRQHGAQALPEAHHAGGITISMEDSGHYVDGFTRIRITMLQEWMLRFAYRVLGQG